MSASPAVAPAENPLRLASAQRKVRSFLAQISVLEASEFAHADASDALGVVKQRFVLHSDRLNNVSPNSRTINGLCKEVIQDIQDYTDTLGIILRASNVRNPFEVYYPLKALVQRIIPNAKLVISSEWDWSPFTYPFGHMESFIFIGSPATEADNVLIVPLSGHEIGHSTWLHHGIADKVTTALSSELAKALLITATPSGLDETSFQQNCFDLAIAQLEEVFCDIVGLYIFSESYLYAYEHILAPGGLDRSQYYPDDVKRVQYLCAAASAWKINYDPLTFAGWESSHIDMDDPALSVADQAVEAVVPNLVRRVSALLSQATVAQPNRAKITDIATALEQEIPFADTARLSEILCAGWEVLRRSGGLGRPEEKSRCNALNEILLKSIEVSEFLRRVRDAQR